MKGREIIRSLLKDVPEAPGIYKMLDGTGNIIYIGKAKNLKKRLTSYSLETSKIHTKAVDYLKSLEFTVTLSETEALLLEARSVKKFKPKFNILLKDDKSFPYIKLRTDHDFPQIIKYRGKNLEGGKFFGPYASVAYLDSALNEMGKIFKLRPCGDNYFFSRKRPCVQYQIKRCYAPCVGKISKEDYSLLVKQVTQFLSGKSSELQKNLAAEMEKLSQNTEFEKAAEIRDRIKALSYVALKSKSATFPDLDADVICLLAAEGVYCAEVFIYRSGDFLGNKAYFPSVAEEKSEREVLEAFLLQFYQNSRPPKEIILNLIPENEKALKEALGELRGEPVNIVIPLKKGPKSSLIPLVLQNAENSLNSYKKNYAKSFAGLEKIKELFGLPEIPGRIEIYDNSHISGDYAVGAMVVWESDGFNKKEYRIFNLKPGADFNKGDDYHMLRKVLERRLTRLAREPEKTPSLIIIDGGAGHLSSASEIFSSFSSSVKFVCMSKGKDRNAGREIFHLKDREAFTLDKGDPAMKFLQILRDEAHNFAISRHRRKRNASLRFSNLDSIENIGPSRKKALLSYFGSYEALKNASAEEIAKAPGISLSLAKKLAEALK